MYGEITRPFSVPTLQMKMAGIPVLLLSPLKRNTDDIIVDIGQKKNLNFYVTFE